MNNNANVFHICGDYHDVHQNLVDSLSKRKINNTVLKYNLRNKNLDTKYKNILFFNNKSKCRGPLNFKKKISSVTNWITKNVELNRFDILHAHMLFTDGAIAHKLHKLLNIPYIVAVRNSDLYSLFFWKMPWIKKIGVNVLLDSKKVIFLSESYRDILLTRLPKSIRKVIMNKSEIIPNGVDDFWFTNKNTNQSNINFESEIRVLSVGRIEKNKNQLVLQKALSKLVKMNFKIKYTIIGDVVDKRMFKKLSKEKFTKILPYMSKEDLIHYYRNNDIYAMPSIKETFGLTYVEALSQGLPVIYTKFQGFYKQFDEGFIGYGVDSYNTNDIADGIIKAVSNYSTLVYNTDIASEKFKYSSISKLYLQLYKNI